MSIFQRHMQQLWQIRIGKKVIQSINQSIPEVIERTSLWITLAQLSKTIGCWHSSNGNISSDWVKIFVGHFTQAINWRRSRFRAILRDSRGIFMQYDNREKSNFKLESCKFWRCVIDSVMMTTRYSICNILSQMYFKLNPLKCRENLRSHPSMNSNDIYQHFTEKYSYHIVPYKVQEINTSALNGWAQRLKSCQRLYFAIQ